MSVHSLNHLDTSYKGYEIDANGGVTEIYDHRGEAESVVPPPSTTRQPLMNNTAHMRSARSAPTSQATRRTQHQKQQAGCCASCVNLLTACGNLPCASAFSLICIWAGTAMFMGGGINALHGTIDLFQKFGPLEGNPATDKAPEYVYQPSGEAFANQNYMLRDVNNLGNRVPQVFKSIEYAMYAIVPFMALISLLMVCDNHYTNRAMKRRSRKSLKHKSSGICCTSFLLCIGYFLLIGWIFFLCFTTLGIYYYRMVMLRCYDLNERGYSEGVLESICVDLVQLGLIMFRDTTQEAFAKICGPGENMRMYGKLDEYCRYYYPTFQAFLITFSGCFLNVLGLVNFLMMSSVNYHNITSRPSVAMETNQGVPPSTVAPSTVATHLAPSLPPSYHAPVVRRGSRDLDSEFRRNGNQYRSARDLLDSGRRRSRFDDFEMDSLEDRRSLREGRGYEDSNMGVNYYYRRR